MKNKNPIELQSFITCYHVYFKILKFSFVLHTTTNCFTFPIYGSLKTSMRTKNSSKICITFVCFFCAHLN